MVKNRHRRLFAVAVAICTTAFFGLVSTPASAHSPVGNEMFNPDEFNGDGYDGSMPDGDAHAPGDTGAGETKEAEVAADTAHEVASTYPLRGTSFTDAVLYEWWDCNDTSGDEWTTSQCSLIASDTTPNTSTPPFLAATVLAWSGEFNVPSANEGEDRHIRGVACQTDYTAGSAGTTSGVSDNHCRHDDSGGDEAGIGVEDMHYDDAGSTADHGEQTSSGHIWALDYGDTLIGPDLTNEEVHGALTPNDGFTVVGFTSDADGGGGTTQDVGAVHFCVDVGSDPDTANDDTPDGTGGSCAANASDFSSDDGDLCTALGAPFNLADCWQGFVDPPDDDQYALSMIEIANIDCSFGNPECGDEGAGDCAGDSGNFSFEGDDCQLDKIYLTSQEDAIEQTHAHNDEEADDTEDDDPTFVNQAGRQKTAEVGTGELDEVIGAFFTQFADTDGDGTKDEGEEFNEDSTWEISGGDAGFDSCGSGTGVDADPDTGLFASCNYDFDDTDSAGEDNSTDAYYANWTGSVEGPVELTFCADVGFDGCGDAAANEVDTLDKELVPGFDHAHLRFSEDIPGGPPPCHTGATAKDKPAGSNVNVTGCVQDPFHQGAAGVTVIWRILSGPGNFGATQQTTDTNGRATAVVTAPGATNGQVTTLQFCTDGAGGQANNGVCDAEETAPFLVCAACRAQIQITWTAAVTPPGASCPQVGGYKKKVGNNLNNKLKGGPTCDKLVGKKGNDKLSGKGEDDLLVGGKGFDICRGGPGKDIFRGCEVKKKGSQVAVV